MTKDHRLVGKMSSVHHKFAISYPTVQRFITDLNGRFATSGLTLKTAKQVLVGQKAAIHFRFPAEPAELVVHGDIAWVDDQLDPANNKLSFLIRNLQLTPQSQVKLNQVVGANVGEEPIEDVSHDIPGRVPPAFNPDASLAGANQAAPAAPTPSAAEPNNKQVDAGNNKQKAADAKRKKILIAVTVVLVLISSVLVWLFALNGMQFMLSRFGTPPANIPAPLAAVSRFEPEPPLAKKVIPKKVYPVRVKELEPIQGNAYNKFIVVMDKRPAGQIRGVSKDSPPRYVITIPGARVATEKPQYFLPFTFVRTVQFDQVGSSVEITFLATQAYLPRVEYELDGRELAVMFLAAD